MNVSHRTPNHYNIPKKIPGFRQIEVYNEEQYMLLTVNFFFGMTLCFPFIKNILKKCKYSPPNEPILLIIGIIMGRICHFLPRKQRCIETLCKNLSEWVIIVVPVMYYKVCFFTEFSRNSRILIQALCFGIVGTAISSVIIGVALKIIENKHVNFKMALMLGLFCVPIYPTESRELRGFSTTLSHVSNLLDGETLIGTITVFYFLDIVIGPRDNLTYPELFLHYILHLVVGSFTGWISGIIICRLMVKYSDLPTIILVIFFVPLIVSVFLHCFGFNEDLAIIIQVLLICKKRTSLGKDVGDFYGKFICLMYDLITGITLVYVGIFIGEDFSTIQILTSLPYIICMYIIVISGRFFSFAVLSSIFNKFECGLTLHQLGLVIWCGVPSILNVLLLINVHDKYGFEKDDFGMVMTRNLGGLVILGYVINTWTTQPVLYTLGFVKSSLARDVNMNICFRWIMETRQRTILVLKLERWFCDAHWMTIKNCSKLNHPHWIISNNEEPDKMALRFAVCNNCKLEFFVPPTFKEYKEMTREARRRVLKSKKNFYVKQYNIGMLSEESYRILAEAVEKGLESPNVEFDTNKFLNLIRQVNLMSHNSHGFWNTYEYRFRMMYPRHMNRLRKLMMNFVVHPLFDLTINFVALSNLMVNIYLLITSCNRPLFFMIYYCFFGVYSFEFIVKIYFFTLRRFYDGIINYFSSVWNMMDSILLLMTFIIVIYHIYEVDHGNVLLVATFLILRIMRISRLFQHFKTCRSVMSLEATIHGDSRARKAYETGKTFIKGEQELMVIVPEMVKDTHITAEILLQMDENIMLVAREIEQIQQNRPQVSIDIKTKQAIRTVLIFMNEEIDFIKNAGWIDEIEYKLLMKSVHERYQYLHTLRKVKRNSPKAFFDDISWLNDNETLTEYLYDNAQNRSFSSQDVIIAKGEHADGIYMVISGLLNIEYEPEASVLDKLERYGALPVIDFMTNMDFKAERREYIVAGNTFGEFSVLTRRPYACSIIADTSCEVLFLPEQYVRSAMNLDNDPVSGMECRMWKNVCKKLTLDILVNARPYRTIPLDEVRQCLDRCFVPKLSQFRALSRTEYIEDIIVVDGAVVDEQTRTYFIAPKHIPRSVQKIFLPGNEKFSLNTEIETKLVLVTIPDAKPEFIMEREKNLNDGTVLIPIFCEDGVYSTQFKLTPQIIRLENENSLRVEHNTVIFFLHQECERITYYTQVMKLK